MNYLINIENRREEENVPTPELASKINESMSALSGTLNEIVDVIKTWDSNKASGPDKISNKMLKSTRDSFTPTYHNQ